ncbi:unnamed protein product [Lasius platythorax]|uniref:Uncharacterized protein n=1 Tax=Lasius platythorax TaxID=488582 RepID=A0AAV2NQS9_9HYME
MGGRRGRQQDDMGAGTLDPVNNACRNFSRRPSFLASCGKEALGYLGGGSCKTEDPTKRLVTRSAASVTSLTQTRVIMIGLRSYEAGTHRGRVSENNRETMTADHTRTFNVYSFM